MTAILPMQWYYSNKGQRLGPVSQAEFDQLVHDGVITADTLVWKDGMPDWRPYSTVGGASVASASDPDTAICAVSGKRYPKREMVQYEGKWISAEHRDQFFERLREGIPQPGQFVYGGFWIRVVAKILDGIIIGILGVGINMLVAFFVFGSPNYLGQALLKHSAHDRLVYQSISVPLGICLAIVYACFFILRWDATPGNMAVGLKLVRSDGEKLTAGRIVGRYFSEWLSALILCMGYVMVAFDDQKQALHDRICDTRVIRVK
jgi:uncharacterized RDD family membrane protein YckC